MFGVAGNIFLVRLRVKVIFVKIVVNIAKCFFMSM